MDFRKTADRPTARPQTVSGGPSGAPGKPGYATYTASFGQTSSNGFEVVVLDKFAPVSGNISVVGYPKV